MQYIRYVLCLGFGLCVGFILFGVLASSISLFLPAIDSDSHPDMSDAQIVEAIMYRNWILYTIGAAFLVLGVIAGHLYSSPKSNKQPLKDQTKPHALD